MRHVAWIAGLTVVLTSAVFLGAQDTPDSPRPATCTVLATFYNDPFENEKDVPTFPITYDPMFAIHAVIDKMIAGDCPFASQARVIFVIHSPSLTFGGYWYDAKQFFLTIEPYDGPGDDGETQRRWTLIGLDWPLETVPPYRSYLVCQGGGWTVRASAKQGVSVVGPFSVFRHDVPVVSLGTLDVARAWPKQELFEYAIEYQGDPTGRPFKPAFRFSAYREQGVLSLAGEEMTLTCEWREPSESPKEQ